ncbi:MAG: mannose-6-phosphate isomerase, class I, partial [Chitinophagaceae bacterium]
LEGQNVELMANSDNVLRGGLTPKHVDVPELLKHTLFEGIVPKILSGDDIGNNQYNYPCSVPDFGINKVALNGNRHASTAQSFEIIIATEGGAVVNSSSNSFILKQGDAMAVLPGESYTIDASAKCILFKAFVP